MRILIIGGTRFIGPRVVRGLAQHGHKLAVFYRGVHEAALPAGVRGFKNRCAQMPITRIPKELIAYSPEVVLHMIAMGERDAEALRNAFVEVARRLVVLSSGDVYRAYAIFKGLEEGPLEPMPLRESSPLRSKLHPYRSSNTPSDALEHYYDKVLVERAIVADVRLPATILRLPKVYGLEDNADLGTVYGFRTHPQWRWTHRFVDNVAAAIAVAGESEAASGRIYNVGEETTPTTAERLRYLPPKPDAPIIDQQCNFAQDIVYDTAAIRRELDYREDVLERDAMRGVCEATAASSDHPL